MSDKDYEIEMKKLAAKVDALEQKFEDLKKEIVSNLRDMVMELKREFPIPGGKK